MDLIREIAETVALLTWDGERLDEGVAAVTADPELAISDTLPCDRCEVITGTAVVSIDGETCERLCSPCICGA